MGKPFPQAHHRFKNGKDHCYWSIVEKVRGPHDHWVQRPILYLGQIHDSQKAAWIKMIEVFDADRQSFTPLALFPLQRSMPAQFTDAVQVRLAEFSLHRPRQRGACWVACRLWQQLQLDAFWSQRLSASREGTDWKSLLQVLTIYRLLDPGSAFPKATNGASVYSRDKRSDCGQVIIALIVTPEGFPLAYEVLPVGPVARRHGLVARATRFDFRVSVQ